MLLADAISALAELRAVFIRVYMLLIFAYVLSSWVAAVLAPAGRSASSTTSASRTCACSAACCRRSGPLDLSPIVADPRLYVLAAASINDLLDQLTEKELHMAYAPVEIRHVQLGRGLFGYQRARSTDRLLDDVADSFEDGLA